MELHLEQLAAAACLLSIPIEAGFNRFEREYGLSSAQDFNPCKGYIACNRSDSPSYPFAYLSYPIHCQESVPEDPLIPYHHHVHAMAINFLPKISVLQKCVKTILY
ncbi:hypothetical protein DAPPUDRAFT_324102 [Daphnia pulex]|uniref:Uncharacterized protein n=1 Tax=Daphnia pulex TaxID=6669 RepID=E9H0P7_DAPPU|nr:hypothetical protein DAPPUDRAFT_324102 [Daphnia pulex]|eukprot:EFX74714.1 hypothetical protein DAPPUDRAFT_324102 [Daphnia pulex]